MSGRSSVAVFLLLSAGALTALIGAVLLYASVLPEAGGLPAGSGCLLTTLSVLVVALAAVALWLVGGRRRRRRAAGPPESER